MNTTKTETLKIHWIGVLGIYAWIVMLFWGILPFFFILAYNLIMGAQVPVTVWTLTKVSFIMILFGFVRRIFVHLLTVAAYSIAR